MIQEVKISKGMLELNGLLSIPDQSNKLVIFAHGSGSSRFSSRNQFVADRLNNVKITTLLFDLLTKQEEVLDEQTRELRFNIDLLAERLALTTDWVAQHPSLQNCSIGYFGASTGAAAALMAAGKYSANKKLKAIVSRGGRPDLAGRYLPEVRLPTLLIVGSEDKEVIKLNELAMGQMQSLVELKLVNGATHLFEEEGTLEKAADLASDWFAKYL